LQNKLLYVFKEEILVSKIWFKNSIKND